MGTRLKYDSTRLGVAILLFSVLYLILIPGNWPPPACGIKLPPAVTYGSDVTLTFSVRAWHPNFSVRQVSFALDGVNSTAVAVNLPFVPINLHDRERVEHWSIGLRNRLTRPVRRRLELRLPLSELAGKRITGAGTLQGSINFIIDHTKVTMKSGYPPLTLDGRLPFTLRIVD